VRALTELVGGFVAGLVVGYVVAILVAPSEGATTMERVQDGASALRDAPRQVQARLQQAVEEGQRAAAETRADLEATAGIRRTEAEGL
jgi:gas vesicle protein